MSELMTTQVKLDARTFWKLAAIAEQHGMRVDQYMVELASIAANRRTTKGTTAVGELWVKGMSDAQMAAELGWTNQAVSTQRRSLGLSANKRNTKQEETK